MLTHVLTTEVCYEDVTLPITCFGSINPFYALLIFQYMSPLGIKSYLQNKLKERKVHCLKYHLRHNLNALPPAGKLTRVAHRL